MLRLFGRYHFSETDVNQIETRQCPEVGFFTLSYLLLLCGINRERELIFRARSVDITRIDNRHTTTKTRIAYDDVLHLTYWQKNTKKNTLLSGKQRSHEIKCQNYAVGFLHFICSIKSFQHICCQYQHKTQRHCGDIPLSHGNNMAAVSRKICNFKGVPVR